MDLNLIALLHLQQRSIIAAAERRRRQRVTPQLITARRHDLSNSAIHCRAPPNRFHQPLQTMGVLERLEEQRRYEVHQKKL